MKKLLDWFFPRPEIIGRNEAVRRILAKAREAAEECDRARKLEWEQAGENG